MIDQLSTPLDGRRSLGLLRFVPDVYQQTKEDSCFHLTTDAVFLTYMQRRNPGSFSVTAAARAYGKALRMVNAALGDRSLYLQDDTILAIWLLGVNDV